MLYFGSFGYNRAVGLPLIGQTVVAMCSGEIELG
jgi:hypothetical protein